MKKLKLKSPRRETLLEKERCMSEANRRNFPEGILVPV